VIQGFHDPELFTECLDVLILVMKYSVKPVLLLALCQANMEEVFKGNGYPVLDDMTIDQSVNRVELVIIQVLHLSFNYSEFFLHNLVGHLSFHVVPFLQHVMHISPILNLRPHELECTEKDEASLFVEPRARLFVLKHILCPSLGNADFAQVLERVESQGNEKNAGYVACSTSKEPSYSPWHEAASDHILCKSLNASNAHWEHRIIVLEGIPIIEVPVYVVRLIRYYVGH